MEVAARYLPSHSWPPTIFQGPALTTHSPAAQWLPFSCFPFILHLNSHPLHQKHSLNVPVPKTDQFMILIHVFVSGWRGFVTNLLFWQVFTWQLICIMLFLMFSWKEKLISCIFFQRVLKENWSIQENPHCNRGISPGWCGRCLLLALHTFNPVPPQGNLRQLEHDSTRGVTSKQTFAFLPDTKSQKMSLLHCLLGLVLVPKTFWITLLKL